MSTEDKKILFQFYDSPIKSFSSSSTNAKTLEFQFYDSPIKRWRTRQGVCLLVRVSIL